MRTPTRDYPRNGLELSAEDGPVTDLIDTVFFASLGKEEGRPTRVRLVYHPNGLEQLMRVSDAVPVGGGYIIRQAWNVIAFEPRPGATDFSVEALRKLAPGADLPASHIVIGSRDGQLEIQGIAHRLDYTPYKPDGEDDLIFVETHKPGQLALRHGNESGYYEDGFWELNRITLRALIYNDKSVVKRSIEKLCEDLIDGMRGGMPWCRPNRAVLDVVHSLVSSMADLHHGGMIAFTEVAISARGKYHLPVKQRTILSERIRKHFQLRAERFTSWRSRASKPTDNSASDTSSAGDPTALTQEEEDVVEEAYESAERDSLGSVTATVAQLTAVDNALVLGNNLELVCAGFHVDGECPVVFEASDVEGAVFEKYPIEKHGSRHRSAATFASQSAGNLVFIASQDDAVRCFLRPVGSDIVLVWRIQMDND